MTSSRTELVPLKFIGQIVSGGTPSSDTANWDGELPFVTPPDLNGLDGATIAHWDRSLTERGASGLSVVNHAVLLSCRAPIGHIGIASHELAFNQGCKAIVPESSDDLRYLAYSLVASRKALEAAGRGTTFTELSTTELSSFGVPWPPPSKRMLIADYLDRETGEINAMLGKLGELARKLEARRLGVLGSVLHELFNGETVPIWSVLTPMKDQNHPREEVLSVYRDYGVIPKSSRDDNHNRTPEDLSSYQLVLPGDLVINKMKAWQGSLGVSEFRGIVSPDYQVARPMVDVIPPYLHSVLRSPLMIPQYRVRSIGVRPAQWRLYWNDFANLRVPLPSLDEQRRTADHLDEVTTKINAMLAKVSNMKSLLLERRAALITDIVTGLKEAI